jgi:hypothetical protein
MMKKSILQVGSALSKAQQKSVFGGDPIPPGNCSGFPEYPNLSPGGYTSDTCTTAAQCPPNPVFPELPAFCDFGCCLYMY